MFWEKLSPFCFSRLAYRRKWIWGPCRPIFLESPDKFLLESHKKNEKLQFFWIHAFSLNFSSWHAECWSDNPSGTFWHVRSCSARSLGIAKAWWFFHICFLSKVPRTVRMQFRQTCWKVLQNIWKIFHPSSEKIEKILDLSNQSLISLKTFLVTQKTADLTFLPKIFRQKHDNFLGRSPAKIHNVKSLYLFFRYPSENYKTLKNLPEKQISKTHFCSKCFQWRLELTFDITPECLCQTSQETLLNFRKK